MEFFQDWRGNCHILGDQSRKNRKNINIGQDFFSVDSENICFQDRTHENVATKGLFKGGEISGLTERARERSGLTRNI